MYAEQKISFITTCFLSLLQTKEIGDIWVRKLEKKYMNIRKRRLEKTSHESSLFEMFINYCGEQVKKGDGWENHKVSTCHRKYTK